MLRRCLTRLISQIGPDTEIVVSDDASVDETASVLASIHHPRLRTARNPVNLGLFGNFNQCLALATGEYILFLSDDDEIDDDLISSCLALEAVAARGEEPVALVASNRYLTISTGGNTCASVVPSSIASGAYTGQELLQHLWLGNVSFQLCGMLFRVADLRAAGGFVKGHKYAGDIRTFAPLFFDRQVLFEAGAKCTYVVHQHSETTALGLNYKLSDLAQVFGFLFADCGRLPRAQASAVRKSIRRYMATEYMRNISDFADAGGSKRTAFAAAIKGLTWIMGPGGRPVTVIWSLFSAILLPFWVREFIWTLQRAFNRVLVKA